MEASQRRGEPTLDGDQLQQVVVRRGVLGVLHERGHPREQDAETVADRLELAACLHAMMMAGRGGVGKCPGIRIAPVRGPVPSLV